jgi:hypothetical protein
MSIVLGRRGTVAIESGVMSGVMSLLVVAGTMLAAVVVARITVCAWRGSAIVASSSSSAVAIVWAQVPSATGDRWGRLVIIRTR